MEIKKYISKVAKRLQSKPYNATIFNHPLALKTSWHPKVSGGCRYKNRTLKNFSNTELHYIGSTMSKVLAWVCILPASLLIVKALTEIKTEQYGIALLVFFAIPLFLIGMGLNILRKSRKVFILDKGSGFFYKGKKASHNSLYTAVDTNSFKLETIKALQIVSKLCGLPKYFYHSFEINLIFEDGKRYNIVNHAKRDLIEKDAAMIADFLDIPVWNKVFDTTYLPKKAKQAERYDSQ